MSIIKNLHVLVPIALCFACKTELKRTEAPVAPQTAVDLPSQSVATPAAAALVTTEAQLGVWAPPAAWRPPGGKGKFIAIHNHVLPNGKLLTWPHDDYAPLNGLPSAGTNNVFVWDPASNIYTKAPNLTTNLFCSGHAFLPDGRLLVLGGDGLPPKKPYANGGGVSPKDRGYGLKRVEIFDYRTNTWTHAQPMNYGRWYGSAITLGNGDVLAITGRDWNGAQSGIPEIWNEATGWRSLPGASTNAYKHLYHYSYLLPDGRVFTAGPGQNTYLLTTDGVGTLTPGPANGFGDRYGGTSVQYADGKILVVGGNRNTDGLATDITNTAEVIDFNVSAPAWRSVAPMSHSRWRFDATLLPDGKVLVTGGTSSQTTPSKRVPPKSVPNALKGAVYQAELWDPSTETWTGLASMKTPRMYHSTAVLLPDARVLVAGGGQPLMSGELPNTEHQDMQIFSPPYLFRGARPQIVSAPDTVTYGQTFSVATPDAASITRVTLLRLSSVTHSFNMNQRIVNLNFALDAQVSPPGLISVTAPAEANRCPPGHYMMFLLNAAGVPSVAKIVRIGVS